MGNNRLRAGFFDLRLFLLQRLARLAGTDSMRAIREGLLWLVPCLLVSATFLMLSALAQLAGLPARVVDQLAGLHAALSAAAHPLVATAPCDSPFLPADLVARLSAALHAHAADLAVARTFEQPHPVFCLCRREVLPHLTAYLQSGERKFERWYATLKTVEVAFDDVAGAFENINTRDELQRFDAAS